MSLSSELRQAANTIRARAPVEPRIGIVLGSGLAGFADNVTEPCVVPYAEIPGFPSSTVPGHPGRLVLGRVAGKPVAVMQGRAHMYEGHSAATVAFPVRVLVTMGVETLILTNAAGGIRADLGPGDLMLLTDHLNLSGQNPLTGPNDAALGPRFPDLSTTYRPGLRTLAETTAEQLGLPLKRGVYACMSGPSYETPAEVRMLRALGGDAVGMSTVCEAIAATHMGAGVLGISCITNHAAGIARKPLSHTEVAEVAERIGEQFGALLCGIVARCDPTAVRPETSVR